MSGRVRKRTVLTNGCVQTLTVLNPMARIDNHIMDDADLAGPVLFCGLFGTFLLLVSIFSSKVSV